MLSNNANAFKKGTFGLLRSVCALSMVANRKALFSCAATGGLLEANITRNSHQLLAVDAASN